MLTSGYNGHSAELEDTSQPQFLACKEPNDSSLTQLFNELTCTARRVRLRRATRHCGVRADTLALGG